MRKVAEKMAKDMPDNSMEQVAKRTEDMRKTFGDVELSADEWKKIEDKLKTEELTKMGRQSTFGKLLPTELDHRKFGSTCGATEYSPPEGDEHKRMLDQSLVDEIERLEDSDYTETKLGKSEALTTRQTKITWQKAVPKERDNDIYKRDSQKMKPQTNLLKRKIQLYGNREVLTIRNQKRGRIDKRNLHRIPMDRLDIFKASITKEDKPLDVCLLVDESGSMGGGRIENARKTCISIKEALQENSMLNLWVMGHTADGERWHSDPNTTNMTLYHSPKMKDRPYAVGAMHAKCENRDGNAILAAAAKVREETDAPMSHKLMIVFSDGSPAAIGYGGTQGIAHTAKAVKSCEAKGWSIIQVGFGGAHFQERMFKNHIYIDDINNIATKVAKIIRKVIKV
jgi:nitric oxide reductase activation protein